MKPRTMLRVGSVLGAIIATSMGINALRTEAAAQKCPRGARACSASQVGQPCDSSSLSIICSAQSRNRFGCLAYAP